MLRATVLAAAIFILTGCDSPAPVVKTETPKKPEVPTGPITALTAYNAVYKVARQIAPDLQTASITANNLDDAQSGDGKYTEWTIVFVSASKRQATTFVYTTTPHDNLLKGMNNQGNILWNGPTQAATPFANGDVSIDSDAAYTAASAKAADWLAKNKDRKVTVFALGHAATLPAPTWYVMWGDKKKGGYAVYVNAATGVAK
jgi:uncharacterized protein YciI